MNKTVEELHQLYSQGQDLIERKYPDSNQKKRKLWKILNDIYYDMSSYKSLGEMDDDILTDHVRLWIENTYIDIQDIWGSELIPDYIIHRVAIEIHHDKIKAKEAENDPKLQINNSTNDLIEKDLLLG